MWLIIVTACLLVHAVLGNGNEQTNLISDLDIRDAAASDVGGLVNERNRLISDREVEQISSDSADPWKQRRGGSWRADAISPSEQSERSYQEKNAERYESGEKKRLGGIVSKRSPVNWRIEKEILPNNDRQEGDSNLHYWCEHRSKGESFCVCAKPQRFDWSGGKRRKRYAQWNIDSPTKRTDPVYNRGRFSAHLHNYRDPVGFPSELNDIKRVAGISRAGWKTPFNSWGGKRSGKWMKGDGKESSLLSRKPPSNADPLNVAQGKLEGRNRWGTRETRKGDAWKKGWTNERGNGPVIPLVDKAEKSNTKKYASQGVVEIYSKRLQLDSSAGQTHTFLRGARNAEQLIGICWMETLEFDRHKESCNCTQTCTWTANPFDLQEVDVQVQSAKRKKFRGQRYYRDSSPGEFGAAAASSPDFNSIKRGAEINRVQPRIPFNSWGGKRAHRFSNIPDKPRFHLTKDELLVNADTDTNTNMDTDINASDEIQKRERISWQSWDGQRNPFLRWIPFRVYNQTTEVGYDRLEKDAQQEEQERGVNDWYGWMPEKKAEQHGQYKKTKFDPWGGKRSFRICRFPQGNSISRASIEDTT